MAALDRRLSSAAEEAAEKIDSKLNCSICLDSFKEPKLLPCFHIFCKSCLEKLVVQGPRAKTQSLTCPTCRSHVALPDSGVAGLQTDFHIEDLFEIRQALNRARERILCENCNNELAEAAKFCQQCEQSMCRQCANIHEQWGGFRDHNIVELDGQEFDHRHPPRTIIAICQKHPKVEAKIYCPVCSKLICTTCAVSDIHKGHDCRLIDDIYPEYKEKLISSLQPLKEQQNKVQQALDMCDTKAREIKGRKTCIESSICLKIDHLQQILEKRKDTLIAILESTVEEKLKELATHRDYVETMNVRMGSCAEYAESCLERDVESEIVAIKAPVLKQIEQIKAEFDPDSIQPQIEADIELLKANIADEACKNLGEIACDPVSTENSYTTGYGTNFAIAQSLNSVELHLMTKQNKVAKTKAAITSKIVHSESGAMVKCKVTQEKGHYVVSYHPIVKGKHFLHIRVNGKHIQGSPYPIVSTPSLESLHLPKAVQGLSMPYGTVMNSKGQLIAIERFDYAKHSFSVLSPEGKRMFCIGTRGIINGHFDFPRGVAVDLDDNIYVADKDNYRIQKFTPVGKFVAAVGSRSKKFARSTGICFNRSNSQLYVCDELNNKIHVITTDFELVKNFGAEGEEEGLFKSPMFASFDSEANNLYVADFGNNRVQVFTAEGEFLRAFCEKSNGQRLQQPFAIAIDSSNIVYVSEWESNSISLFTAEGRYIMSFGSSGSKEGEFNKIRGIHIDQHDSIFVSDHKNNRVQIFN